MSTISLQSQRARDIVNLFIGPDADKKNIEVPIVAKQLIDYLGKAFNKYHGFLPIQDKAGNVSTFAAAEMIQLIKKQVSDVLGGDKATEINKALDSELGQAFVTHSANKLAGKITKNPEMLLKIQEALSGIKLPEGTDADGNQMVIFNAVFETVITKLEKTKANYSLQDLTTALETEAKARGLTKKGLAEATNEMTTAGVFFNAKNAAKAGLGDLIVNYQGEFNFAEGTDLKDINIKEINSLISKYISTVKQTKNTVAAKAQLERDLAKMGDKEKAFAKYALGVGNKLNSEIDLDQIFNQLGNFLPGLLGSGVIGYIFSSLLGVSGVWGVVGSLVMTALAATDDSKQKPPAPNHKAADKNFATAA